MLLKAGGYGQRTSAVLNRTGDLETVNQYYGS